MAWGKSEAQRTVAREQDINSKLRKQYTHATERVQIAREAQATTALEADIVKIDTSRLRAELEPLSADEVARREAAHKEAARAFSTWSSRVHELKNQLKDSDRNLAAAQRSVARELYIAYLMDRVSPAAKAFIESLEGAMGFRAAHSTHNSPA